MKNCILSFYILLTNLFFTLSCKKDDTEKKQSGNLQLVKIVVGTFNFNLSEANIEVPFDKDIVIEFSAAIDTITAKKYIAFKNNGNGNSNVNFDLQYSSDLKSVIIKPLKPLRNLTNYTLQIASGLTGFNGERFAGTEQPFTTINGKMVIENITINGISFTPPEKPQNIDYKKINIEISFSDSLDATNYNSFFSLSGNINISYSLSANNKKLSITSSSKLNGYSRYYFTISENLKSIKGYSFDAFSNSFYTSLDSTYKYPLITNYELLTLVQKQTFKYFWDFGHPSCGLARERNTSGDLVTIGGSGFGIMALIIGMERGFITRTEGTTRLSKILSFLETCDRYHGAWPHWLNGSTGKTIPFSVKDDGGDLVETSFMIQGLIAIRQYLAASNPSEKLLIDRINALCNTVEYDWFTQNQNVLYWHWSPNSGWAVNVKLQGYNETLITYVLAAGSPTHTIPADAYKTGYTRNGAIKNGNTYYGYKLPLGEAYGGPLFFTHYSFLGLDPRNLKDAFANYWEQNVNQSLINWLYCSENPKKFVGYGENSWGLTASDNPWGYNAHSPGNDLGVISPTAAISSIPYTPVQSMNAIKNFYYLLGDKLWGNYGFYDAYNVTQGWWATSYLAIDQGPIICMIENYRTGLLWNLFMSAPELKNGLDKLGFTYQ